MSHWESTGKSDEWYTPKYVFDAMGKELLFDLDVASPDMKTNVPCKSKFTEGSLEKDWSGFVWMNPPFGGRNSIKVWLDKFFQHSNGIALTPDRTSADWWQEAAHKCDALLLVKGKIKFERPDGSVGKSPSNGTTLFAIGIEGCERLKRARDAGLGIYLEVG